jgi:alpha-D-xyloside xylohydrolase
VIYSAWDGYANFAFDIGGYREQSPPPAFEAAKELFIRWAQLGALLPLMENGGGGEHKPWAYDDETTTSYRAFVALHSQLSYYLQTVGSVALEQGKSAISPQEALPSPIRARSRRHYPQPKVFSYTLGPDIFVHPILHQAEVGKAGQVALPVTFPASSPSGDAVWLDYWRPADKRLAHKGGETALRVVRGLSDYPVWVRQGALLPLSVDDDTTTTGATELLVFAWFLPVSTSAEAAFDLREFPDAGPGLSARAVFTGPTTMRATLSAHAGRVGFRLVGLGDTQAALVEATAAAGCAVDAKLSASEGLTVVCPDLSQGAVIDFRLTGV